VFGYSPSPFDDRGPPTQTSSSTTSTPIVLDHRSTSSTNGGRPTPDAVAHLGTPSIYLPRPVDRERPTMRKPLRRCWWWG